MRVHQVGYCIKGFYRLAQLGYCWAMPSNDAQPRLQPPRHARARRGLTTWLPLTATWPTGCWLTLPCCPTIASGVNLRYNSSFTRNPSAKGGDPLHFLASGWLI